MPLDNVVFWVFAPIAVAAAIGMLVTRSVVYAALFLVVNFGCIAVMYLVLDAAFLFAVQIIVYAGAIMVLFRDYFFPFEATSILLIVAAIAAMVLAQRKVRAITQAELGEELEDEAADDVEPEIEVTP